MFAASTFDSLTKGSDLTTESDASNNQDELRLVARVVA